MESMTYSVGYRFPFAWVAFGGEPTHWWTYFLKRGFYHCFVILGNGREWCIIDPVLHYTDFIMIKTRHVEDLFYNKGYQLVRTTPRLPTSGRFRLRPYTCVETVKRFLGIESPFLWTPYQLFCWLKSKKGK